MIKMVMAMRHGVLPRTLHVDRPTPEVDWGSGAVELLTEPRPWPAGADGVRRAGISSFGISGTNVHVVIEEPPPVGGSPSVEGPPSVGVRRRRPVVALPVVPWVLSARTAEGVRAQAERLRVFVGERPDLDLSDVAFSLATTRQVFAHRAVVVGADRAGLLAGLGGVVPTEVVPGGTGFVFTGQGAQRAGMGSALAERFPVFAAALGEVCAELDPLLGRSLRDVIASGDGLHETGFAQPGLFAVEVALFRLLVSWGVAPDFVAGHSVGEIAAAHVAGVLDLADACRLVAARGRLMQALPAGGAMVAVRAGEAEVASLMDPMLGEFRRVAESVTYREPSLGLVSTVTAELEAMTDPEYWVRQVRRPVRFADAVTALAGLGVTRVAEVGPDAVLTGMVAQVTDAVTAVALQRRGRPELDSLLTGVARLHAAGGAVDWPAVYAGTGARRTDLPTYPFHHQHYWLASSPRATASSGHSLLGAGTAVAGTGQVLFTSTLSTATLPWLTAHAAVPPAVFVEMAVRAGDDVGATSLAELEVTEPLVVPTRAAVQVQVVVEPPEPGGRRAFAVHARPDAADVPWTVHATGVLTSAEASARAPDGDALDGDALDGDVVDIRLPADLVDGVRRFGLHPELLDQAVPTVVGDEAMRVPAVWRGVRLHATGGTEVRAWTRPAADGGTALLLTDAAGEPVLSVESIAFRDLPRDAFTAAEAVPATERSASPRRRAVQKPRETLANRLAGMTEAERGETVLNIVRTDVAAVGGRPDPMAIRPEQSFQELGFDSLTAVELRNRLTASTGITLPATLAFDQPTPAALAAFVLRLAAPAAGSVSSELDRLEALLAEVPQAERDDTTARLQAVLARWTGVSHRADAAAALETASAAEILDFIDNELGRAAGRAG